MENTENDTENNKGDESGICHAPIVSGDMDELEQQKKRIVGVALGTTMKTRITKQRPHTLPYQGT